VKKLTAEDLKIIHSALTDVYEAMKGDLATDAELCTVIVPLVKIEDLMKKAVK
jgi:hypothetical protein